MNSAAIESGAIRLRCELAVLAPLTSVPSSDCTDGCPDGDFASVGLQAAAEVRRRQIPAPPNSPSPESSMGSAAGRGTGATGGEKLIWPT
jgi:hypothetical protein